MHKILLALCVNFTLFSANLFAQNECANWSEPVQVVTAVTELPLFVETTTENDLAINPLTAVNINLQHGWIGDVVISLVSPAGTEYILIGDDNNMQNGCGSSGDGYFDVSITADGTEPLTPGLPYNVVCSGGYCVGEFGVYCPFSNPVNGGFSDVLDAAPTPNCTLDDFNVPGEPITGTWTLKLGCVCSDALSYGYFLESWSLEFADQSAIFCEMTPACDESIGDLQENEVSVCINDIPYPEAVFTPTATVFADAGFLSFIVVNEGTIEDYSVYSAPDYLVEGQPVYWSPPASSVAVGTMEVYAVTTQGWATSVLLNGLLGLTIEEAMLYAEENCMYISNEAATYNFFEPIEPEMTHFDICEGECVTFMGVEFCEPGVYQVALDEDLTFCGYYQLVTVTLISCIDMPSQEREICIATPTILSANMDDGPCKWSFSDGTIIHTDNPELELNLTGIFEHLTATVTMPHPDLSGHIYRQNFTLYPEICDVMTHETNDLTEQSLCFPGQIVFDDSCENSRFDFDVDISEDGTCLLFTPDEFDCENICIEYREEGIPHSVDVEICAVEQLTNDPVNTLTGRKHDTENAVNQVHENNAQQGEIIPQKHIKNHISAPTAPFTVFPNPANDFINLSWEKATLRTVHLIDVNGMKIKEEETDSDFIRMNINDLQSGIYFLSVSENGNINTEKLIVFKK